MNDITNKKKVMLIQPMAGKTNAEIMATRKTAIASLENKGYEVINSFFKAEQSDNALYFLAKSLEKMSLCDAVYLCPDWENARGCQIEYLAAKAYGLKIIL